jgi:hypothetical protein
MFYIHRSPFISGTTEHKKYSGAGEKNANMNKFHNQAILLFLFLPLFRETMRLGKAFYDHFKENKFS